MKWRVWLLSLGITLFCVLIFGLASTQVYYKSSVDDGRNYLSVYMNEYDESEYPRNEAGAKAFSEKIGGARVTFMDAQGHVVADSEAEKIDVNHSDRAEIIEAIENGVNGNGFAVRSSETIGKSMMYYCRNFDGAYLVRIAIATDSDWMIFVKTLPALASFFAVILMLCVAAAFIATNIVVSPVRKLAEEAAANDNVTSKYTELQPVAELLNERSRNIHRQMEEIQAEKEAVVEARASKDEFIANVTHEMNTPLTSIRGYAELLGAGGMSEEQKAIAYKTILTQSDRLSSLIACIINYSEIESDDLPAYEVDFRRLRGKLCAR